MRIEINGGRGFSVLDVISGGDRWASIGIDSSWPSITSTMSKITPKELRAIAAACTSIADRLEPLITREDY